MCGIAGVSLKSGQTVDQLLLRSLADALTHRGPDGEGMLVRENSALVHRRLSIIDLEGGAQPISNMPENQHIVCNGEIYNFVPLQKEIKASGVELRTSSDSETALHMYKLHGLDFVKHLEGMYALAILDDSRGEIILARDPFGIKPLYFAQTDKGVAFASEPSSLTKGGWIKAEVNEDKLPALFNRQYVAGHETLFKGIERVMPGEVIVLKDGEIQSRERHPIRTLQSAGETPEVQAQQSFDKLYTEVVTDHLQSEVPYGVFLSGGIDSSAVSVKMNEIVNCIRSFTVGFESDTVADERSQAQELADALGSKHISVSFDEDDFWRMIPSMCKVMDDLVADYAALPLLKLSQRARKDVKVILSGEGGDEIFAGYGRYRKGWLNTLRGRPFRGRGDTAQYTHLFREEFTKWKDSEDMVKMNTKLLSSLQKRQAKDMASWLPDDLLTKVDRCLMAYGIEGRVPFLDTRVAGFAFSLSDKMKVRGKNGKWLLKKWLADKLSHIAGLNPKRVWEKKKGFTVPIHDWMDKKRPQLTNYLGNHEAVLKIVKRENLLAFLSQPFDKKGAKLAFTFLCYAQWYDQHILGKGLPKKFMK